MTAPHKARTLPRVHHTLPWSTFARRLLFEINRDNVFGRAAELAYFFLLSIFPLLIVVTTCIRLFGEGNRIFDYMLNYFGRLMPPAAYDLIASTLQEVTGGNGGARLSFGIFFTLASASSGMVAVIEGLNTAYQVREARSWWKRRVVAVVLTLGMAAFGIAALAILLYGNQFGLLIADKAGLGSAFRTAWPFVQWPLMAVFALLAFALVYRYAPNLRQQCWHWTLPGALLAFGLWLLASFGLRVYLGFTATYRQSYGSLNSLIVLMIWFYLFGAAILIGGEANSIVEQAAAGAGDPEAKLPGEKAPGEAAT